MGNCLFCGFVLICCNSSIQASYLNMKCSLSRKLDNMLTDYYCGRNLTLNCMASYLAKAAVTEYMVLGIPSLYATKWRKASKKECQT